MNKELCGGGGGGKYRKSIMREYSKRIGTKKSAQWLATSTRTT